ARELAFGVEAREAAMGVEQPSPRLVECRRGTGPACPDLDPASEALELEVGLRHDWLVVSGSSSTSASGWTSTSGSASASNSDSDSDWASASLSNSGSGSNSVS